MEWKETKSEVDSLEARERMDIKMIRAPALVESGEQQFSNSIILNSEEVCCKCWLTVVVVCGG